jgi:hypothetical protein
MNRSIAAISGVVCFCVMWRTECRWDRKINSNVAKGMIRSKGIAPA